MQRTDTPLSDAEIAELDEQLSSIHAPLQPMDACAVDGYLCGVLLQPVTISMGEWLPLVFDLDGHPAPTDAGAARVAELVARRHEELRRAIEARRWFDPWIFESDEEDAPPAQAQLPWVAGFAAAQDRFPALMGMEHPGLLEPLAVLYSAFDPEDLEDADELLALIETLEPPTTMADAAEDLVRSVLLLADVTRPLPAQGRSAQGGRPGGGRRPGHGPAPGRRGPARGPRHGPR
jgi:uncharacterized protein